eukprot:6568655-Pyramimonas_sp.AAC.1
MAVILGDWRLADFAAKWRGSHPRTSALTPGGGGPRSWPSVAEVAKEALVSQSVHVQPAAAC